MIPSIELGCLSNSQAISKIIQLSGKFLVDVGCGDMGFSKLLVDSGAQVLAIDPDPDLAQKNRIAATGQNINFRQASADQIPIDDHCADGLFMVYTLHHIPAESHEKVFQEAIRVLKPDGFLFIIAPTHCPIYEVINLFNNETESWATAEDTLLNVATPLFKTAERYSYYSTRVYESFEDFATVLASRSFGGLFTKEDVNAKNVRDAFEELGAPDYEFQIPRQITLLKCPKATDA